LNAFVFGHGPMTITLVDVYMLTGLRITGPIQPYELLSARSKKLTKISDCIGLNTTAPTCFGGRAQPNTKNILGALGYVVHTYG